MQDTDAITSFFERRVIETVSRINGLVLAGGRSTRLGYDKSAITWFGKEQRYYAADLLRPYCAEVFISCRNEQEKDIDSRYRTLTDTFTGLGPYGAILSAFRQQPDDAWLVLACDLPLIDVHTIEQLVKRRNPSAVATTFESPYDHLPEPLITIWEPKAYPVLLSFLAQGYSCPRKVLRNNDVEIIQTDNPDVLMNVNTPEEVEKVKKKLLDKSTAI
jgi:molybdopterin-guanine dinucleotide biosynthesis protein A